MSIQFELEETFAATPEVVFAAISDFESYGEWMPNFVRVERLSEGEFGVGTKFRETRKMFGKKAAEHFEVTECEPGKALTLFVDGSKGTTGKGEYRFRYTFEPAADGGARLIMRGEVGGMGRFAELIGRFFVGSFKKAIAKDHAALAAHIEERSAA